MIDFINLSLLCKYRPNLSDFKVVSVTNEGRRKRYKLKKEFELELDYDDESNLLYLKGSLPYFAKGYNISFSKQEFVDVVEYLSSVLGLDLWESEVLGFEYGVIVEVADTPKNYIQHHYARDSSLKKKENEKFKGKFVMWEGKGFDLKMYDALANLKKKKSERGAWRQIVCDNGWIDTGNYLKFEVRYNKPTLILNEGRMITLSMLADDVFLEKVADDVIEKYSMLRTDKSHKPCTNKRELTTANILAMQCLAYGEKLGKNQQEIKCDIGQLVAEQSILNKNDKSARKKQINKEFAKQYSLNEGWNVAEKIRNELFKEKAFILRDNSIDDTLYQKIKKVS